MDRRFWAVLVALVAVAVAASALFVKVARDAGCEPAPFSPRVWQCPTPEATP